jgi:DNA modification methylase
MNIQNIKPYEKNAKKHDKKQIQQIANSIKEFGFNQPIVIDKNNVVIVGHGRLEAAKLLGLTDVPTIQVNLTEEQAKAYRLADNKLNESEWDMGLAIEELKGLSEEMFDLTGFDKDLLIEPDAKDDVIPEDVETVAKLGDIWQLGRHRVMCGDSTIVEDVYKLMNNKLAELLFTSPPYSDMRDYNGNKDLSVSHLTNFITLYTPYSHYQAINLGIQRKDNNINEYWNDYINVARENGYKMLSWNVWVKQNAGSVGNQSAFIPIIHEWIFVFGEKFKDINRIEKRKTKVNKNKTSRKVRQADGSMVSSSVGEQKELKEMESVYFTNSELSDTRSKHPATFPVDLAEKYIRSITDKDDIVIDPFLGSGSTLIACEKTNRICYGMELDPKYVDVIIKRWEDYTGNKAIKL